MKSGRPVLYELLKTNPTQPQDRKPAQAPSQNGHAGFQHEKSAAPPPESDRAPRGGLLANGRTVRMPAGYIFVFVALLILCGAVAYIFGYVRGESEAKVSELDRMVAEQENARIGEQLGGAVDLDENNPGAVFPPRGGADNSSGGSTSGNAASSGSGRSIENPGTAQPRTFSTSIEPQTDPRIAEHYYFRLISTIHKNAMTVAEFCRENGVEAFILGSNNDSDYFTVYVLPGFKKDERQSPAANVVRDDVDNVVKRWHVKYGRERAKNELGSYYLAKYNGN